MSPFTPEQVKEWASLGPKLKGKPTTDEELQAAKVRKAKSTALLQEWHAQINDPDVWTMKKIEKELDRLVEEGEPETATASSGIVFEPPSGTRDFYPPEMRLRSWLFQKFRDSAAAFGFVEYDAPVLEQTALYERKAGEEIVSQMYAFQDPEEHRVTLRPEMTPSLARLVLQRTNLSTGECREALPLKWYSIPQCWRFETTQRGRKREHYQWNMDIVGVSHVHAELELLAAACHFFQSVHVGPDLVGIKINSRAVLESILAKHDITKSEDSSKEDLFAVTCVIIDKLDKIGDDAVTALLVEKGIPEASCREILQALQMESLVALAEYVGADTPGLQDIQRLFLLAKDYGIADYLVFDASVVRGLAYYTGIVWEAFDRRGELRAIMGGGRYDRLLELYGGPACSQLSCVGFGFGDCVIMELLQECQLVPSFLQENQVDYVVCAWDNEWYGAAAKIAAQLRTQLGAKVDLMPTPKKKVANSFKYADQKGAQRMVFVAPSEMEQNKVRIKDLRVKDAKTGEGVQIDCPLDQFDRIDAMIAEVARA
ncbi:histidyl-tRNA synthetase [Fistulifera solaris]|uniref:histidine--tRNA ligase n=1 Tax=Fistulifera solaris TaxID=1519565 RepID=A0A1Z5KIW0_FISSO|nr:histidyl-tRNA synthetase [Fistulifera solaris]|eukprot:GAX26234.1 histidyl-tRNA synthetase [Fistulifera solaris]